MAKLRSSSLVALLLAASWGAVAIGQAAENTDTPMGAVQWSNDAVLEILDEQDPLGPDGESRIYEIMDQVTDFDMMSSTAIGDLCEVGEDKCTEWRAVFSDLLRIRSIKGVGRYRAERFEYINEEIDGDAAVVFCLAYYEGEDLTLDYELEHVDGKWFIVNYVIDDVDTARSYRRRFTRLLRNETIDDIIQRLRKRIVELEQET